MLNCIIIEDEPLASTLLATYIQRTPYLRLDASFGNAIEAGAYCRNKVPELVFLDVQLPGINGIQFLKSLENPPIVIFTTAFSQYAIEGFELAAIDYLLKPFNYARFQRAAMRAKDYHELQQSQPFISNQRAIYVKSNYQLVKIDSNDILFVEGMDNYAKFYLKNKANPIVSINTLKNVMDLLPEKEFLRIHKSFIVPLSKIEGIHMRKVKINNHMIPIGNSYWDNFREVLGI
ncbi:MAG: LytTR family DNA-binding domain-containing protein [Saprospiraceae bacterium]|nr:LytTR family DNA-binding domain-containing protein [Saprospiraceae bacterium]